MSESVRTQRLRFALESIEAMPCSMVNDSESLRHTIRTLQHIAREALKEPDPRPRSA